MKNETQIKQEVKEFWNNETCGIWSSQKEKFTKEYYQEIEDFRYFTQPEIFSFAQFTRYSGKKILEVGVGAGTDFLQWARAGAIIYGIDLTEESINHTNHRLELYGYKAEDLKVADCENLPYPDNYFDVVFSWGVIHHTPDTEKALNEIYRVCKKDGICKVMIYHRHSLLAHLFWFKHAILKGKFLMSVRSVLYNHMESIGTKGYTKKEVINMLENKSIRNLKIQPVLTYYDKLIRFGNLTQKIGKILAHIFGKDNVGWFLTIEFEKE
jgi:ubiquinone/menaquinone biosynthesis C-methylase UbiE